MVLGTQVVASQISYATLTGVRLGEGGGVGEAGAVAVVGEVAVAGVGVVDGE